MLLGTGAQMGTFGSLHSMGYGQPEGHGSIQTFESALFKDAIVCFVFPARAGLSQAPFCRVTLESH